MNVELDHVFICTSVGAPDADQLRQLGLTEGEPNRHRGQGTANRRFFFRNAMLELLWVDDPAEAQSNLVRRTGLWERWSHRSRGASPFGVCLRPAEPGVVGVPFPAWEYRPPYLPEPLLLHMGANSETTTEPLLFYFPFLRPDPGDRAQQELQHPLGFQRITRLCIRSPQRGPASGLLRAAEEQCRCLRFESGDEDLLELGFDDEIQGKAADCRPGLPLILRW
jgi:hypothetical protein